MVPRSLIYFCLPTLLLAVPIIVEDGQSKGDAPSTSSNILEDELYLWHLLNQPENHQFLRSMDSLGHGNILRSLDGGSDTNSWLGGGNFGGWRQFNGGSASGGSTGSFKRGGGMDSLGHGNILRSVDSLGHGNILRSMDSLGHGNILRSMDSLGHGNILRSLDSLGRGNILRSLDSLGRGNILRSLDSLGRGHILKRSVSPQQ